MSLSTNKEETFDFQMNLAHLVDFAQLNKLNLYFQSLRNLKLKGTGNIFIFKDKLNAFIYKIDHQIIKVGVKSFFGFEMLKPVIEKGYADICIEIRQNIPHLVQLKNEFTRSFSNCNGKGIQKLICNPFLVNDTAVPNEIQQVIVELQHDMEQL